MITSTTRTSKRVVAEASRQRLKEIALREAIEWQKDEEDTRQRLLAKKKHASSAGKSAVNGPTKKRGRPPSKRKAVGVDEDLNQTVGAGFNIHNIF